MAKLYGWEETIFSFMKFGKNFILIGSSNAVMVVFFLSGIKYIELAKHQIFCIPDVRNR